MIERAITKMRSEIEEAKDPMTKMLGQQIIDNITTDTRARAILQDGKTLLGCKKDFDNYASSQKQGNQSIIGPKQAEELIFKYYGFDNEAADKKKPVVNIMDFM